MTREEFMDIVYSELHSDGDNYRANRIIDAADEYAEDSSSEKPKMGKWVILKDEYGDITEAVCSCCDKNGNHKWAYCPNCGAKMQEVEG